MNRNQRTRWIILIVIVAAMISSCGNNVRGMPATAPATFSPPQALTATPTLPPQPSLTHTPPIPTPSPLATTDLEPQETEPSSPPKTADLTITILYDNVPFDERLDSAWGFSALIEYAGHTVLFDTGGSAQSFMKNMSILGVDPKQVDAVVISHSHGDHIAGLLPFLDVSDNPPVYLPPSFPASLMGRVRAITTVVEVDQALEIVPGIYSTGGLAAGNFYEQGLVIDRGENLVILTGCAHPGIVNIVRQARLAVQPPQDMPYKPIALVLGGFHLLDATKLEIESIIADMKALGVEQVSPTHCSGDAAIALFQESFGQDFLSAGVGRVITLP